jgi:drug/metabolite transporter (DMT)-like permease
MHTFAAVSLAVLRKPSPYLLLTLSALFLGEKPRWYHLAGIALVFTGVYLCSSARAATPARGHD